MDSLPFNPLSTLPLHLLSPLFRPSSLFSHLSSLTHPYLTHHSSPTHPPPPQIVALAPVQARRNAFILCIVHRSLNAMLRYYKGQMCPNGQYNQSQSLNVIHWPGRK